MNLPLILVPLLGSVSHLYSSSFGVKLLLIPSPPSGNTSFLNAFWFTHIEQPRLPSKLNIRLWPSSLIPSSEMVLTLTDFLKQRSDYDSHQFHLDCNSIFNQMTCSTGD